MTSLDNRINVAKDEHNAVIDSVNRRAHTHLSSILGLTEGLGIVLRNDTARITIHGKHEITISNLYRYGQEWDFVPQINWFGSSSTRKDDQMLQYLIVVGVIAKDLLDPLGFCSGYLKSLMIELNDSFNVANDLIIEKNSIIRKEAILDSKRVANLAISNLKTDVIIEDSSFKLQKNSRHSHAFEATLKLLTVTDKTVTVNVYRKGESVSILTKRIPRDEFLSKYRTELAEVK